MDNDNNDFFVNDYLATLFYKLEAFDESARHVYSNLSKSIPKLIEKISKDSKDLSFSIDLISNLDLDNDASLNNFIAKIIGALDDFVAYFNSSTTSLESQFSVIRSKVKDIEILEDVIEKMKKAPLIWK